MTAKVARTFEFSKGIVTAIYDPESPNEECIRLDHSCLLHFTMDEAHRFYAWYMDFLAHARDVPQRPRPAQDFSVKPLPNGDFEVVNG